MPAQCQYNAQCGGDALAAAEAKPYGKEMSEHGAQAANDRNIGAVVISQPDREGSLAGIEQKGRGRQALSAGSQYVGGADIAGAYPPDIVQAGKSRQQQAERDGTQKISTGKRCSDVRT